MRHVIASPDLPPNGLVSVGYLLRREGRRAAHAADRPLVPRARDLLEAGVRTSTHRAAVAAGALLAVTTVLGSNALGDSTIISDVGVDHAADAGPAAVPPPAGPLPLAAADAPVRNVMAALQSAGAPVRAVLVDGPVGLVGSGTVSGAGIVAAALGTPTADTGTRPEPSSSSGDDRDDRSTAGRSDDSNRDSGRDTDRRQRADRDGRGSRGGSDEVAAPSRPVVPLPSVNPNPSPSVTGSDIVDRSLGGSGSSADGGSDRGSDNGSDGAGSGSDAEGDSDSPPSADGGDTGAGSGNTTDVGEQDGAGENASSDSPDDSSSDSSSSGDKASGDKASGDKASGDKASDASSDSSSNDTSSGGTASDVT